ncbi:hypothetical protein HY837_05820 [archaeon]|nr:hypothetical protein [archaeon]
MPVFDMLNKKRKKELDLPLPPPPPPDAFEFPDIPARDEEVSISKPEPIPIIDTSEDFKKSGLSISEPRELKFKPTRPVFISLDDFKKVNENLLKIRSRIEEANDSIEDLEKLYEKQQKSMTSWIAELESIEKKISQADEIIGSHEKR